MTSLFSRRLLLQSFAAAILVPARAIAASPLVTVHKDPDCGCCSGWVTHLEQNGFPARVIETREINRIKTKLGVPSDLAACHSAEVEGYVVEGHVPAAALKRLLAERPKAAGLSVPGMPSGSPGMGGDAEEYDVILFGPDGRRVYARFKGEQQI